MFLRKGDNSVYSF